MATRRIIIEKPCPRCKGSGKYWLLRRLWAAGGGIALALLGIVVRAQNDNNPAFVLGTILLFVGAVYAAVGVATSFAVWVCAACKGSGKVSETIDVIENEPGQTE